MLSYIKPSQTIPFHSRAAPSASMCDNYYIILDFYKNNILVRMEYVVARDFDRVSANFNIADYDRLVVTGRYECSDSESDDETEDEEEEATDDVIEFRN